MTGTLLSSFSPDSNSISYLSYLAWDPADNTLWMGATDNGDNSLYQYSTSGAQLETDTYGALANQNILGGEFAETPRPISTPEPSTVVSVGLGAIVLTGMILFSRRRKTALA